MKTLYKSLRFLEFALSWALVGSCELGVTSFTKMVQNVRQKYIFRT